MMVESEKDKIWSSLFVGFAILFLCPHLAWSSGYPAPGTGCISAKCHAGIESISNHDSEMSEQIYEIGESLDDPNGCVVCHGGDPSKTEDKSAAHKGAPEGGSLDIFVQYPGSMWINDKTCGECHPDHAYALHRSVMNTEAGKIQGGMWGWGAPTGSNHVYGNYDIEDSDGSDPVFGTEIYNNGYIRVSQSTVSP